MYQIGDSVTILNKEFTEYDMCNIGFAPALMAQMDHIGTIVEIRPINEEKERSYDLGRLMYRIHVPGHPPRWWPEYSLELATETVNIPGLGEITLTPRKETTCSK